MHRPRFKNARAFFASCLGTAVLAGCSGGSIGDVPSKPLASEYGPSERLCGVIGPADWADATNVSSMGCAPPPPDHSVYVTGLKVGAIDRYDETGNGAVGNYYLQDTGCEAMPYAGVTVFDPSFSPPDLRVAEGDVVDVTGTITEFIGPSSSRFSECATLPEISGTMSFRFDDEGPPTPIVIPASDLKTYATARRWLGMLVKVPNITLGNISPPSGGRYQIPIDVGGGSSIDQPKITNELYDVEGEGPTLATGQTFQSVTGIVTYFYGFHLAPRSPADFEQ